jgi:hypothetical protein
MKTHNSGDRDLGDWPLRIRVAGIHQIPDSTGGADAAPREPVVVDETSRPLGWIERTLLAVDTNRVFLEVPDPRLRAELVAEFQAEKRDVIVASNSHALLEFMKQLPIPTEPANDVVIAEDDFPGTTATDLRRQLQERGWAIPVFTVWNQTPCGGSGVAS